MFSASITPSAAAAALASLGIIETQPQMRHRVLQIAHRVRTGLAELGFSTAGTLASPIVPVIVGNQERMLQLWRTLFDCGLFTNAVTQPAVPPNMDLIRTSYIASHTDKQIDQVLSRFAEAGKRSGVLSAETPKSAHAAEGA
jgi:7-keto-8-aminopelargonate synthetase-like enzyme